MCVARDSEAKQESLTYTILAGDQLSLFCQVRAHNAPHFLLAVCLNIYALVEICSFCCFVLPLLRFRPRFVLFSFSPRGAFQVSVSQYSEFLLEWAFFHIIPYFPTFQTNTTSDNLAISMNWKGDSSRESFQREMVSMLKNAFYRIWWCNQFQAFVYTGTRGIEMVHCR